MGLCNVLNLNIQPFGESTGRCLILAAPSTQRGLKRQDLRDWENPCLRETVRLDGLLDFCVQHSERNMTLIDINITYYNVDIF